MKKAVRFSSLWLPGFILLEILCLTYLLKFKQLASLVSLVYFLCGIAISASIIFLPPLSFNKKGSAFRSPFNRWVVGLFLIGGSVVICYIALQVLNENPIDYHNADMLPVIQTMGSRFVHGHWDQVYDNIPEIWNGSVPVYLPAMWLPFTPLVWFHLDIRWITIAVLVFLFAFSLYFTAIRSRSAIPLLISILLLFAWILFENDTHGFLSFSEEGVVVIYYFFVVFALASKNIYAISIGICLCLLSRYALIGWVPAYFIYLLLKGRFRNVLVLSGVNLLGLFLLLIIPFGWNNFIRLLKLPASYISFSKRVWQDSPDTFRDYLGFARYFIPARMEALHLLLIVMSFIVPLLFVLVCHFMSRKWELSNIPIAALKISIVIFYNLMMVPYLYLFFTSSFVSIAIGILYLRSGVGERTQARKE